MNVINMSFRAWTVLLGGALGSLYVSGCGGSKTITACGEGTTYRDGMCVVEPDASADAASGDTAADIGGEVAVDGAGTPDEPCGDYYAINCSSECNPVANQCDPGECAPRAGATTATVIKIPDSVLFPDGYDTVIKIRTPSHPEMCTRQYVDCAALGKTTPRRYHFLLLPPPGADGRYLKLSVGTPWHVFLNDTSPWCQAWPSCLVTQYLGYGLVVFTEDPNAPARDVTLTISDTKGVCP